MTVVGSPHGYRPACTGDGMCMGMCDGTITELCVFPGSSVECAPARCRVGVQSLPGKCDGMGACSPGAILSCGDYQCGENECKTKCSQDEDCINGRRCLNSACVDAHLAGGGCGCGHPSESPGSDDFIILFTVIAFWLVPRRWAPSGGRDEK